MPTRTAVNRLFCHVLIHVLSRLISEVIGCLLGLWEIQTLPTGLDADTPRNLPCYRQLKTQFVTKTYFRKKTQVPTNILGYDECV